MEGKTDIPDSWLLFIKVKAKSLQLQIWLFVRKDKMIQVKLEVSNHFSLQIYVSVKNGEFAILSFTAFCPRQW